MIKDAAVDWSFARELGTIALQTSNPPRSRTVWFVLHEGALYVPSGMAASKSWPQKLAEDPVVLLRVGEDLYVRTAHKVEETDERAAAWELVSQKYDMPDGSGDERNWMYRMTPSTRWRDRPRRERPDPRPRRVGLPRQRQDHARAPPARRRPAARRARGRGVKRVRRARNRRGRCWPRLATTTWSSPAAACAASSPTSWSRPSSDCASRRSPSAS